MNDFAKGANKATKQHHGTTEQQQWRPKTTTLEVSTATSETQKKKDKAEIQRLGQQK
jgi:hypothetical protein